MRAGVKRGAALLRSPGLYGENSIRFRSPFEPPDPILNPTKNQKREKHGKVDPSMTNLLHVLAELAVPGYRR